MEEDIATSVVRDHIEELNSMHEKLLLMKSTKRGVSRRVYEDTDLEGDVDNDHASRYRHSLMENGRIERHCLNSTEPEHINAYPTDVSVLKKPQHLPEPPPPVMRARLTSVPEETTNLKRKSEVTQAPSKRIAIEATEQENAKTPSPPKKKSPTPPQSPSPPKKSPSLPSSPTQLPQRSPPKDVFVPPKPRSIISPDQFTLLPPNRGVSYAATRHVDPILGAGQMQNAQGRFPHSDNRSHEDACIFCYYNTATRVQGELTEFWSAKTDLCFSKNQQRDGILAALKPLFMQKFTQLTDRGERDWTNCYDDRLNIEHFQSDEDFIIGESRRNKILAIHELSEISRKLTSKTSELLESATEAKEIAFIATILQKLASSHNTSERYAQYR